MICSKPNSRALLYMQGVLGFDTRKILKLKFVCEPQYIVSEPARYAESIKTLAGEKFYAALLSGDADKLLADYTDTLTRTGVGYVTLADPEYPAQLREIGMPPAVLYYKGDYSLLETPILGVVGAREPSRYGLDVTALFAGTIAKAGVTIASGFARGVDSAAHRAALKADGKTIAVFGCGIDLVYPSENADLYKRIAEKGLLLSEYAPGTPAIGFRFPERNRIISGISRGVLVTEARRKSGSLITADCAIEQGRHLFVVPAAIGSKRGEGSNDLIRKNAAAFVSSPDHVLEDLGLQSKKIEASHMQLDYAEAMVIEALGFQNLHFDALSKITGLGVSALNALLAKMELLQLIKKLDNNYYGV